MRNSVAAALLSMLPIYGQVAAALSGTVTDQSGAAVSAALVTVKSPATGAARSSLTDSDGHYLFPSLPVGEYEIRSAKTGFTEEVRTGIRLLVGQSAVVNLELRVGQAGEQITVRADAPLVSTTTADISGVVSEQQVKDLPLNGRSYDELLTLNPGVVNFTWEKTGGIGVSNSTAGNNFAVNGNRPQQNLFLLNGVEFTGAAENNMQPGGASQQLLGVDAVLEFNVLRDSYSAAFGKRPGAQVVIVTESGTNQFHGSLYEFLRNSALDARNFFDGAAVPGFQRNQFGAALGGPVRKDKTFVFGNYEGFRQHLHQTGVDLVPDQNARNGYLPCKLVSPPSPCPSSGLVFVGISPLINAWPAPSPGAPDFGGISEAFNNPLQTIRDDFGTLRVDQILSPRDSLSGVYTIDDSADFTPTSTNAYSTDVTSLREQVASVQETHVFSARHAEYRAGGVFPSRLFLHRRAHARHARRRPDRFPCRNAAGRAGGGRQRRLESHRTAQSRGEQQRQQSAHRSEPLHVRGQHLTHQRPPSDHFRRMVPARAIEREPGAQPVRAGHLHQPRYLPPGNHWNFVVRSFADPARLALIAGRVPRRRRVFA